MKINEVEQLIGITKRNIRFYEKEKLIEPSRNERNGYRDYSENDVENIKKIAYLRTLGISIEDIRSIISEKAILQEMLERQNEVLKSQIADLIKAKLMCEKMLEGLKIAERRRCGSSLKFCLIAAGQADVYPCCHQTKEWDTAAAHAVLTAAGGEVYNAENNTVLTYRKPGLVNPRIISFGQKR